MQSVFRIASVSKAVAVALGALCLSAVLVCTSAPALAQDQVWSSVNASGPASPNSRWLVWFDGHARFRNNGDTLDTIIVRPGVGYRVSPRLDLWLGYAHVTNRRSGPDVEEHRVWQQATYPIARIAGGALTGRTRFEQRFREGGDDTGLRLRQFIRWSRSLGDGPVSAVLANETFVAINDTDWGQRDGFDQNRAFVGLAWQVTPKARFEAGYLNQRIDGGNRPDAVNDTLSLAAFASF